MPAHAVDPPAGEFVLSWPGSLTEISMWMFTPNYDISVDLALSIWTYAITNQGYQTILSKKK